MASEDTSSSDDGKSLKPYDQPPPLELEKLSEQLRPFLREPNSAPQVLTHVMSIMRFHRGPLPPHEDLKGYDLAIPGSGREIVDMAVREQGHRHRMDALEMVYPYLGLVIGSLLAAFCFGAGFYLMLHDKTEGGIAFLSVTALGVISWFVNARINRPEVPPPEPQVSNKKAPSKRRR